MPQSGVRVHSRVRARLAAPVVADLGFVAFAERNRPRYTRYAGARLPADAGVAAVVCATLAHAYEHWAWLLSQPCPAADVWTELHYQVGHEADVGPMPDSEVAALYRRLPASSADSVVLCCRLRLNVDEAAELMGVEPPVVHASLGAARRVLPDLVESTCL